MNDQVKPHDAETFAALDLGSNSFHLIVARYHDQQLQVIDHIREMVRLGGGLVANQRIVPKARKRALACLERFSQRLRSLTHVRVIGTNALRQARNAYGFLEQAEQVLGHKIEVISGFEEARLIYLGVAHSMQPTKQNRLIVDIGGGSTEIIIGKNFQPQLLESIEIGCVQLSELYFEGTLSAERFREAELAVRQAIRPQQKSFQAHGWQDVIGTSGTIRAVLTTGRKLGLCDHVISFDALSSITDQMTSLSSPQDLTSFDLTEDRAAVFPGGLAILTALFKSFHLKEMQVSDSALREGVMWDMIGRTTEQDIREASILSLAKRCQVDEVQAATVTQMALALFDAISKDWQIDTAYCRSLLRFAAMISEIGLSVSHHNQHKHGAYLFRNSDLGGFSMAEQEHTALLIAAQHGKFPKASFKKVAKENRNKLRKTALLLRLALLFQRDREQRDAVPLQACADLPKRVRLKLEQGWLAQHPLTAHRLREEKNFWSRAGFQLQVSSAGN